MERVIQRFSSFDEAERADREYFARMTPQERLRILEDIVIRGRGPDYDPKQRLARVYRIVKFQRS